MSSPVPRHGFKKKQASKKLRSSKTRRKRNDSFLQSLTGIAALCKENNAQKLFSQFIVIPNVDVTNRKTISNKPKKHSRIPNEVLKVTKDHKKHRYIKEKGTNKKNNFSKTNSALNRQVTGGINKRNAENKNIFNPKIVLKNLLGLAQKSKYVDDVFDNLNCQVNGDINKRSAENINILNPKIELKNLLGDVQKNNYEDDVFDKQTVRNAGAKEHSYEFVRRQEENVSIHRELNGQDHLIKLMNKTMTLNERHKTGNLSRVSQFCVQCQKYVEVHLFQNHTAAHENVRERSHMTANQPEPLQDFQAPYRQLDTCAEPADRQAFLDIPSDGNCFFFSVIKLLNLSSTPSQIRRQLLFSPFVNSCLNPDGVRFILRSENEFAEMDCVDIFSKVYDKNVCVHYHYVNANQMEVVQYCHFRVTGSRSFLHLHLQNNHYVPLTAI